jgi:hypothetical protein
MAQVLREREMSRSTDLYPSIQGRAREQRRPSQSRDLPTQPAVRSTVATLLPTLHRRKNLWLRQ